MFERLEGFDPHWVGSTALDVHIEGSDIDICCTANDDLPGLEAASRKAFGKSVGFSISLETFGGQPSCIAGFEADGISVQIWGRAHPVSEHEFYRYYKAEEALLRFGGERLQAEIRAAKQDGLKTETAFAAVLGLEGEPEAALLELYEADALTVMQLLKQAGYL